MHKLMLAGLGLALLTGCGPKADRAATTDSLPPTTPPATIDTGAPSAVATPARPDSTAVATTPRPSAPAPAMPAPKPASPAPKTATKPAPAPVATPETTAAAPAPDPYHPAPRDTLETDTYQGWKQYELNCSRCHGEYAVGTSFAPSLVVSLKEGGTIPDEAAFMTVVCAGRLDKGMPSWCALGLEMDKIQWIYKYAKGRADGKYAAGRPAQRQ